MDMSAKIESLVAGWNSESASMVSYTALQLGLISEQEHSANIGSITDYTGELDNDLDFVSQRAALRSSLHSKFAGVDIAKIAHGVAAAAYLDAMDSD
jgi:hypothetical protein